MFGTNRTPNPFGTARTSMEWSHCPGCRKPVPRPNPRTCPRCKFTLRR
ncbi:hypothetical protein [Streptomyces sp. NPDC003943]